MWLCQTMTIQSKMSMKNVLSIILCIFPALLYGQDIDVNKYFANTFDNSVVKGKYGKFKGQFLKGKCNGMGILLMKDNSIYIGDFMDGDITGYGMKIANEKQGIKNCPQTVVYVGNWNKGQKSGIGTCYNKEGSAIYHGTFLSDKPSSEYLSESVKFGKQFSVVELSDGGVFIGETTQNLPNGMGIVLMQDGDLCQNTFKDGERCGIGLYLMNDGNWETVSFENGKTYTITSSENYNQIDNQRKQMAREAWANAGKQLAALSLQMAETIGNIYSIANGTNGSASNVNASSLELSNTSNTVNTNGQSSNSVNTKSTQMSMSDQVNYNSMRNTYNKWAQDLMQMKNANGKYQNGFKASDKKHAQDEMKRIRKSSIQKWNKEIPYKSIEDW